MKHTRSLTECAANLLPAIAYADAAGLPVETWSAERIYTEFGSVRSLLPTCYNSYYEGEFAPGNWSDDTQLSLAVTRALVRSRRFDMHTIADEHVVAYDQTPQIIKPSRRTIKRGWGRSTTKSVERYMAGVEPANCGERTGAGNGVIMKMAPLALWLIAKESLPHEAYRQLDAFTSFTHGAPEAYVASRVHYDVLNYLAREQYHAHEFGRHAHKSAVTHEQEFSLDHRPVSRPLLYLREGHINYSDVLSHTDRKGFYAPQTLAMSYGAFMTSRGRLRESIYTAVNLGGDTDSTASISAAMSVVAGHGLDSIESELKQVLDIDDIRATSQALSDDIQKLL